MTSSSEDEFLGDAVIEDKRTSKKVIKTRAGRESHPPLRYCEESDSDCSKQHVAAKKTPTVTAVVGSQGTWLKPISGRTLESDSVLTKRILEHVSHVAEPFSEKPSDLIPEKVETVSLNLKTEVNSGFNLQAGGPASVKAIMANNMTFTAAELTALLQQKNTTIISGNSLPVFRGRKRPSDPTFEEKNSFNQHIALLRSHISTLENCTEADKKQLLLRSADTKVGDFHITCSGLINSGLYTKSSFEDVVTVLQNIYITNATKTINSICRDIKETVFVNDDTLPSQIVNMFTKSYEVTQYLLESDRVGLLAKIPVRDAADTDATFLEKQKENLRDIIHHVVFLTHAVPQFSEAVTSKVVNQEFGSTEQLLTKVTQVIRELPIEKKPLAERKPQAQASVYYSSCDDPPFETFALNQTNGRGHSRGQPRGTQNAWRSRPPPQNGRGWSNQGRNTGTQEINSPPSNFNANPRNFSQRPPCYICNKTGHWAAQCNQAQTYNNTYRGNQAQTYNNTYRGYQAHRYNNAPRGPRTAYLAEIESGESQVFQEGL
ncbi:hypothetical protein CDIK_3049 [Cucumispora dikerogammari]|nr:hypothetical protein CDIK_3049 [Cucumispora dikerogammari]